jgi:hypothetical protein
LFCAPEIAEAVTIEINRYAQKFLENMPNLKRRPRTRHWKETDRNEIMDLLEFFCYKDSTRNRTIRAVFSRRKILGTSIFFGDLFNESSLHLPRFLRFVDNESYDVATCDSKRLYELKPILDHQNAKFMSVYTPECDVSVDAVEGMHSFKT